MAEGEEISNYEMPSTEGRRTNTVSRNIYFGKECGRLVGRSHNTTSSFGLVLGVAPARFSTVSIQIENSIEDSHEALFEDMLRRISVKAFDALLTYGVRDVMGFLSLTAEEIDKAGVNTRISAELLAIQQQIKARINPSHDEGIADSITEAEHIDEQQTQDDVSCVDVFDEQPGTPIPEELLNKLSTRGRNVLAREQVTTCEQLLAFQQEDLFKLECVGTATVHDIQRLQESISQRYPKFGHLIANQNPHSCPKCVGRPFFYPRLLDFSRLGERRPSDPAGWSILTVTLPELFHIDQTISRNSNAIVSDDQPLVSSLNLQPHHIEKLRVVAIFIDDPVEALLSLSVDYLLQANIDDEMLFSLLDYIAQTAGYTDRFQLTIADDAICDNAIFHDLPVNTISELRVANPPSIDHVASQETQFQLMTWGEVALLSERSIFQRSGFTKRGFEAIRHVWNLKLSALRLVRKFSQGLPAEAYCSFEQLIHELTKAFAKNDRECRVLKGRLGVLDGRKWTLEELGNSEGVTRERIRQIEKKRMPLLKSEKSIDKLNRLWCVLEYILTLSGGVSCASEVAVYLSERWRWPSLPTDEAMASLVSLSPKFEVVWASPIRIISPGHPCVNCSEIGTILTDAVVSKADVTLPFEDAVGIMHSYCRQRNCGISSGIPQFSKGFLHFIDDAIEEILADETMLYNQYAWAMKYGKRRRSLAIEKIMLEACRPMHFTEVHTEMNKDRPEHGRIAERNVYSYMFGSPDLLLWGRGTYIHRNHVSIPFELICEIESNIIDRLDSGIPYLSVNGIFEKYAEILTSAGVPSESALYSCLRESNNPALAYPDYPNVMKRGNDTHRMPLPLVLESFVLSQKGTVTWEEVRDYAVERLCVNESLFLANHFPNIPNLLRVNRGEYIHMQQLGVEKDRLTPIVDHLTTLLGTSGHISVAKLFNDKRVTCRVLGITTPMLLFSILHELFAGQFDLSKYPSIRMLGPATSDNRSSSIATEVISYILQKRTPCSFAELYEHFVDGLGYEQRSIYNIHLDFQVMRYSEGMVVHLGALGWTVEKQVALEALAESHLHDRQSAGKPFGLVNNLYEYQYDELPALPDQILWTPTLIVELLSRVGNFHILGSQRNAFTSVPNVYGIESLDDLLYYVLDTEYDGAANVDAFVAEMRDAGILLKSLTPMMLGAESRVTIDGDVVLLTELTNRATRTSVAARL